AFGALAAGKCRAGQRGCGGSAQSYVVSATMQAVRDVCNYALDSSVMSRRLGNDRIQDEQNSQHHDNAAATALTSAPRSAGCSQCQRRSAAAQDALFAAINAARSSAQRRSPSASRFTSPGEYTTAAGPSS